MMGMLCGVLSVFTLGVNMSQSVLMFSYANARGAVRVAVSLVVKVFFLVLVFFLLLAFVVKLVCVLSDGLISSIVALFGMLCVKLVGVTMFLGVVMSQDMLSSVVIFAGEVVEERSIIEGVCNGEGGGVVDRLVKS